MSQQQADIGLIGLAVMGQNLALNIADHGFHISVWNRTTEKTTDFVNEHPPASFDGTGGSLTGYEELKDFVESIKKPRKIVSMVQAGRGTDAVIDSLVPLLDKGDVIIDGGNAHWEDTIRREKALNEKGLFFVGSGVSGGELGARFGPSLMPGGAPEAWAHLEPIWTAIAAKVDKDTGKELSGAEPAKPIKGGVPCTALVGPDGAGHYVKMVHNGIEYGDMQMICEAYFLMRHLAKMEPAEIGDVFAKWNTGILDSFLIEITADILKQTDPVTGKPFVDIVLDTAGQKGTGRWTSVNALDMGVPANTIAEAVFARAISAIKDERVAAAKILGGAHDGDLSAAMDLFSNDKQTLITAIEHALYCSKICSYAQGFQLMRAASDHYDWKLNFGAIASIFRGGCIIRAQFLQKITEAYERNPSLANLVLDEYFAGRITEFGSDWRRVVAASSLAGIPCPAFSSALAYFDGYRTDPLPANLLQSQRDYFGAHTYERVDQPRGKFFHLDWPVEGRPQLEV
ncbi:MAG: NADP-dependent phosphogluconate dehydrogenase [Planctomycetota bacterium]